MGNVNADTTQYLSTTEFANRYNAMMPIDKDHLPLEPSFVELLCQKGEIEHSELQPGKGNKKYIYKIPEYELDRVAILINGDEFVEPEKVKEESKSDSEKKLLTTKDVAELLGCHVTNIALMVKNGKLKPARNDMRGSRNSYKFDEDYILKYMEEHPKHANKKKETPVDDKTFEIENLKAQVEVLRAMLNERDKTIDELLEEKDEKPEVESFAKDIFEAYRKGFKDGFEMGGKQ